MLYALPYRRWGRSLPDGGPGGAHPASMDPRWQPHLGALQPDTATPEACGLHAAGWQAQAGECRIAADGADDRLVSPETWHALRDRFGFTRARVHMQQR